MFAVRASLPDRPGSLAAVAGALAAADMDIVALEVIDRDGGQAVDRICVEAPTANEPSVRRVLGSVPGVVVESVSSVLTAPASNGPLRLAGELAVTNDRVPTLVRGLPSALWCDWCALLDVEAGRCTVADATPGAPAWVQFEAPWLPLSTVRRLDAADWMPAHWRIRSGLGLLQLAAAPLGSRVVLVARMSGAAFRAAELERLALLTTLVSSLGGPRPDAVGPLDAVTSSHGR